MLYSIICVLNSVYVFCIEVRVRGRRELLAKFTKLSLEQIELTYLSHRKGNKKKNSFKTLIGSVSKKISGVGGRPPPAKKSSNKK